MLTFIARFFKGLIIGWIMSLIMYLVKRALTKSFGSMQGAQQPPRPQNQRAEGHDIVETIWAGMSTAQLRTSFGAPKTINPATNGEVWIYTGLNGQGIDTAITIENNSVKHWQNIRDTLPAA
jgi:hypothetical protein